MLLTGTTVTNVVTMTNASEDVDYRLPRNARPTRYRLRLEPDLERATFTGDESVELEVLASTSVIVMNACDLEVTEASIASGWTKSGDKMDRPQTGVISLDIELERVTFAFATPLEPGRYTLDCAFQGELNDKLCGFYRSSFTDENGVEHTIATTQFEETDARKAFPCFDEPDRKAVFDVTLDVPATMTAVSNGPEISSIDLDNGRRRVHFGETIPMSTYLVAFVVGPLVATPPLDVDGVELRAYTVPGKLELTEHALQAGAHALRFFADYFDIPYPGTKLDLLALPDFAAGAMENLGCVTFRETILLADPDGASRGELERLAEVVEHEIAHMWFGDLVTMGWWNGIWLNEAFATFMSLCCLDDYKPEWNTFVSFCRSKAAAFHIDALHTTRPIEFPVRHPDEASVMFDVLTYEKGASVLWMIEQYLGRDRFRAGIRRYLKAHLHGNTETGDLWDAIEAEAGDVPIRAIMDSWIYQGGFPAISTELGVTEQGASIALRQEPFSYLPKYDREDSAIGSDWLIPVVAVSPDNDRVATRIILGSDPVAIPIDSFPLLVNAGGSGFFRVNYDPESYRAILADFDGLREIERFNLVADTWAFILSGTSELTRLHELTTAMEREQDPHVWSVIIGALNLLDQLAPSDRRLEIATYTRALLRPLFDRVGWEPQVTDDEQTPLLRSSLVLTLGTTGKDRPIAEQCRALFDDDHSGTAPLDPDLAAAVLGVVASDADDAVFETILDRYRNPKNPNDQLRHLSSLAHLGDTAIAHRVHAMCLDEIRSQDAPYLLGSMMRNRAIGESTWQFITANFDELLERFPDNSIPRMLEGISALAQLDPSGEPILAQDIEQFCDAHIEGPKKRLVEQSLERLAINVRLAGRLQVEPIDL